MSRFEGKNPNWLRNQSQRRPQVFPEQTLLWSCPVYVCVKTYLLLDYFSSFHVHWTMCKFSLALLLGIAPVCVWELWVTYTHSTSRLQTMHLIMLWQTVVCKKIWTSSELVGATTHHSHIATVHFIYPVWKQNIVQNRALYGNYFWQGMLHYTYNLRLVWTGLREWNSYWYKTEQCTKLEITVVCQNYW